MRTSERKAAGWLWPVAILALCHAEIIASFQILAVLVEPIKAAIGVSDTQYSLMQGLAVAVFASLLGIPAARMADGGRRRGIVLFGMAVGACATFGCAMADSFGQFFAARMLVGLGEAFLIPTALSLIAEIAPPNRLSGALGLFGCGGPLGAAAALVGGGWLAGDGAGQDWRLAFEVLGGLGLLTLPLILTLPLKQEAARGPAASFGTFSHIAGHIGVYGGVCAGMLALSACVFAVSAWGPTMLVRGHGLSYADAGVVTGLAALCAGTIGTPAAGFATDRLKALGKPDAALLVSMTVAALMFLTVLGSVAARSPFWSSAFLVAAYGLLGMPTVVAATALQEITPPAMRAQVMAVQVFLVNLVSLSLGPTAVALITDHVFGGGAAVGRALVWIVGFAVVVAIGSLAAGRRQYRYLGICTGNQ